MSKSQKALEYIRQSEFHQNLPKVMGTMFGNIFGEKVPSEIWIESFSGLDFSQLNDDLAQCFVDNFTEEDLDQLLEYSKTDVFKKYVKLVPDLQTAHYQSAQIWFPTVQKEWVQNLRNALEKHGMEGEEIEDLCDMLSE